MRVLEVKSGLLAGCLPFARLGDAPGTLAIFPGLADAAWDVTSRAWALPEHYRRFADEFTVYIISRKRRLPAGYTTRDMAADYAKASGKESRANVVAHFLIMVSRVEGWVSRCAS